MTHATATTQQLWSQCAQTPGPQQCTGGRARRGAFLPLSLARASLTHPPFPARSGYSRAGTGVAGRRASPGHPDSTGFLSPRTPASPSPVCVLGREAVYLFMTHPASQELLCVS